MSRNEKKLSRCIDDVNGGKKPKNRNHRREDNEYSKLTDTVKKLHSLKDVEYPDAFYEQRLIHSLLVDEAIKTKKVRNYQIRRTLMVSAVAIATAMILMVSLNNVYQKDNTNIVYAMGKAFSEVKAYHGIIEVTETNGLGETMTQSKREIWADVNGDYYIKELEGVSEGVVTVNNGQMKWQLRPNEKEAYIYTSFPDPYHFTFDLGSEMKSVKDALTVKLLGEETISNREASKYEITPDGGDSYYLWVDSATDLPLQKQSALQNALQYKISYTSLEFTDKVPTELLEYSLPSGYGEVNTNPEQIVATMEEAEGMVGFQPVIPKELPKRYTLEKITTLKNLSAVKLYYNKKDNNKKVVIMQSKVSNPLSPVAGAILGTVNHNQAEIITSDPTLSIRWQEQGMEYSILGESSMEDLTMFAESISEGDVRLPSPEEETTKNPKVKVDYDLTTEQYDQKSVDAGHSPWKLDPIFVTQVFASLLLSPEGIVGDYPIAYSNIVILENNGTDAIAEIKDKDSIAKYVYLKRLVRQDDSGIWTVVGYDPTE